MAYETRCPECNARLRFDDEPEPDEAIECAKCGHQFDTATAAMGGGAKTKSKAAGAKTAEKPTKAEKKAKKGDKPAGANDQNIGKRRKVKKKKSNRGILLIMLVGALVILGAVGAMGYFLFSKSAKIPDMAQCLPADCNIVRGVNTSVIIRYKAFKTEYDKQIGGTVYDSAEVLAKAGGLDPGDFLDYVMVGKRNDGRSIGEVIVYRTTKEINGAVIGPQVGSATGGYYKVGGGKGALSNACVYFPSPRLVVVVPPGPQQTDLITKSVAARQNKDASFAAKMGDCGEVVSRGQIWTLIKAEGPLKNYIKDMGKPVQPDFKSITDVADRGTAMGYWASYGARGIAFGMAVECDSPESAATIAKSLRDGEMGKGDEAVIPNSLKSAYGYVTSKEFVEFLSNMSFRTRGNCAYLESRMLSAKAGQVLTKFASTSLGDTSQGGVGQPIGGPMGGPQPGATGRGGP